MIDTLLVIDYYFWRVISNFIGEDTGDMALSFVDLSFMRIDYTHK